MESKFFVAGKPSSPRLIAAAALPESWRNLSAPAKAPTFHRIGKVHLQRNHRLHSHGVTKSHNVPNAIIGWCCKSRVHIHTIKALL